MVHLKPYFNSGAIAKRGTFVIGTVSGDLHDIGKNLVYDGRGEWLECNRLRS